MAASSQMHYRRGAAARMSPSSPQLADGASDPDVDHLTNSSEVFGVDTASNLRTQIKSKMQIPIETEVTKADRRRAMIQEAGLAVMLFGIVCTCYIIYQYLQEWLMRVEVVGGEKFNYPVFLVCACFAVNLVTTSILLGGMQIKYNRDHKACMYTEESRKGVFDMLDLKIGCFGMLAATSNVVAMTASLVAIKFVGAPTQIVIKSAKMIPILIGGWILFRKRYPIYDYVAVLVLTTCIFMFNFFKPNAKMDGENTVFGLCMCFLSLLMDGITGPIEDKMMALKDIHPYLMLFILNFFGFPVIMTVTLIAEGTEPIKMLFNNPQLWGYVLSLAVTASVGQVFIVLCLKLYGSLYTTAITTIRKIVSSLLSIYMFEHPMSSMQWVSMAGTFGTLFARQFFKYKYGGKNKKTAEEPPAGSH